MKLCHIVTTVSCLALLASAATPSAQAALRPKATAWETECSSTDGWNDNHSDPKMGAIVSQYEPSVLEVRQDGSQNWGKVSFNVGTINLEDTPLIEAKVNMVDVGSAFQIAIAPEDWSDMLVVVPRTSAHGVHKGDVLKAIKKAKKEAEWESFDSFHIVIIVEGKAKSTYFDHLRIRSKN